MNQIPGTDESRNHREHDSSLEHIYEVLEAVREALFAMLTAAGMDPAKGRETARDLGIDRHLAWRIARIVGSEDILAVAQDIPTSAHMEKICAACAHEGAPDSLLDKARETVVTFEQVVDEVAGNRQYFEAMVSGLPRDDVTQRQENTRKLNFISNLAIWGLHARVNLKTMIYAPGHEDPNLVDIIRLGGLVDFKRSRPIEWPIHRLHGYYDDGSIHEAPLNAKYLSGDLQPQGPEPPLLKRFCSKPLPELIIVPTDYGTRFDLPVSRFGNAGSLTCIFGDLMRGIDCRWRQEGIDEYISSMNDLYTPTELVVHDVFLHRDLGMNVPPEIMILDRLSLPRGVHPQHDENHRLPLSSKILRVSAGPAGCKLRQYPDYSNLIQYSFDQVGWASEDFQGYRFTMTYPPLGTAVMLRSPLPVKPTS